MTNLRFHLLPVPTSTATYHMPLTDLMIPYPPLLYLYFIYTPDVFDHQLFFEV